MTSPLKRLVFLSYSHADKEWLERLQKHLLPLLEQIGVQAWDDRDIRAGQEWYPAITDVMTEAKVVVLLVTPDFFTSQFIKSEEWPRAKERYARKELSILWIAVRPSIATDTELGRFQGLNDPKKPLEKFTLEGGLDDELIRICRDIKRTVNPFLIEVPPPDTPPPPPPPRPAPPATASATPTPSPPKPEVVLPTIRTIPLEMATPHSILSDASARLWVANAQQVKIFLVHQERAVDSWSLPGRRWKGALAEIWQNQLVYADWEGSLFASSRRGPQTAQNVRTLYAAGEEGLPVHRLAVGPEGHLAAAAWDGTIRLWRADGQPCGPAPFTQTAHVPLHLLPLAGGGLALADQRQYLRVFDAAGRETWSWLAPEAIESAWTFEERGQPVFVVQVGARRFMKIAPGQREPEVCRFAEPIQTVVRRRGRRADECAVVVRAGGKIDWLLTSSFGVLQSGPLTVPFEIRDIVPVFDAAQRDALIAVGITTQGRFFTVRGKEWKLYDQPADIERMALDYTGRFVFLLTETRLIVCRTPELLPIPCKMNFEGVSGALTVNEFRRIKVSLKNACPLAIHEIKAELCGNGVVENSRVEKTLAVPLYKDQAIELEFMVLAKATGELPCELKLQLADRGGPPYSEQKLTFPIECKRI